MSDQELSHQELYKLVLDQRRELEVSRKEFADFRSFVGRRTVPLEEKVFAPKRATYREREAEVERATKAYHNLGDKRAVGFLADLQIDLRERAEAFKELSSVRFKDKETGELGAINWDRESNRDKIAAFLNFIAEDLERGERKLIDQWDQYAIAKDSRHGWATVKEFRKSKTFDHMGYGRPSYEDTPLTHEEKDEKYRKAEKDVHFAQKNSGGKAKGVGLKGSSGSSSSHGKKVELVSTFYF